MRVLLADDHALLLEGLQNLLEAHGVEVAGTAKNGHEAAVQARRLRPDLILMDIRMPVCDGLTATRTIKAEMPEIAIVILTTSSEDQDLFEAIKSGASGYLLKSMDAEGLIDALQDAQQDIPPFAPGLAAKLLAEFARTAGQTGPATSGVTAAAGTEAAATEAEASAGTEAAGAEAAAGNAEATATATGTEAAAGNAEVAGSPSAEEPLSPRQVEVLTLVAQGLSYKEVGDRVYLSPRTVKYHMAEIMRKLHFTNRAQVLAQAEGLIGIGETTDPR
jgi:DNA-binding NarL/FixJ family response regulator